MSEPLKIFYDIAKDKEVDDKLLNLQSIQETLDKFERLGKDLGEKAKDMLRKPPDKPNGPTPTYQESAFINKDKETTLYNVTNLEREVPLITKASKVLKRTTYSVKGFSGAATFKNNEKKYSLIAGEHIGFNITKDTPYNDSGVTITHKVSNNKTSIEYFSKSPINKYSIALFNQNKNVGITGNYSDNNGFSASVSIDKNSAAGECSYNKRKKMCDMKFGAYATTGENYSKPFVGVKGRITF